MQHPVAPTRSTSIAVAFAVALASAGSIGACAAGDDEELGHSGPAASAAAGPATSGGPGATASSTGAGTGASGPASASASASASATSSASAGGAGGMGSGGQGGGGTGGQGGSSGSGTVLLLASGGADVLAGEFQGAGWTTTNLADATTKGPAVAITSSGLGVGLIRSNANAGELRYTTWGASGWSLFAAVAAGVTTQGRPSLTRSGTGVVAAFHGDDFKHYAESYAAAWSVAAEPMGAPQSFGPSPASICVLGSDVVAAFAGDNGDLFDQTRSGGAWQAAHPHSLGSVVQVSPSIVAMTAGPELLVAFVRSTDAKVMWTSRTGGTWTVPVAVDVNAFSTDPVGLTAIPGGDAAISFRGLDGKIYAARYTMNNAPPWSVPAAIANPNYSIASSPALAPGIGGTDAELVFVDAATGGAVHTRLVNTSWSAPTPVGGSGLVHVALTSAP